MFSKFDEEAKKVLVNMKKEMFELRHPYIGTEHLFLSILKYGNKDDISKLHSNGITYEKFKNELIKVIGVGKNGNQYNLYTPLLKNVMETATLNSNDHGKNLVDSTELLMAIFDEGEGVAIRILIGMGVDIDNLYDSFYDKNSVSNGKNSSLLVNSFGVDLSKKAMDGEIDPVIGRDREISRVLEILSRRTKNNPILIGDAGVGKTAIVEELARRLNEGVISNLRGKRIVSVSMASLVAGTKYRGEFEERIEKMLLELEKNEDIILFIDEIHTLVGAGGAEGAIDASNILKPALARGKIRIIGATTRDEYKEFIESDKALCRRFQKVEVLEPDLDAVFEILEKLKPIYEDYHHVVISRDILEQIIYLSDRYIYDRKMPDKAIDILDEVCSRVSIRNQSKVSNISKLSQELLELKERKNSAILHNDFKLAIDLKEKEVVLEDKKNRLEFKKHSQVNGVITLNDVKDVVSQKSRIPVFDEINDKFIMNIKRQLKSKIFGQDKAIDEVCKSFKKIKLGFKNNHRPYSYLFAGPTGVGKTLLVKEFAKCCYGEDNFIRLDMSEFQEEHTINKIIGSSPGYVGYDDHKNVFELVKDNPYSVILLDEIEKAHPSIVSLFFQILDEGKAKNSKGEEVRFDNTIIFMTSNIGFMSNAIGFGEGVSTSVSDITKFLGVSFMNRVYKVICFEKIGSDAIDLIVQDKIARLRKNYKSMGVRLSLSKNVVPSIIKLCDYETFGARGVDKVIEDRLESLIVDQILLGNNFVKIAEIEAGELV